MKWNLLILASVVIAAAGAVRAHNADADVAREMKLIQNGQAEVVKADVPALLTRYPNNPGVLYLQALTTNEGADAVRIYQSIVDNFPASEWADDALYKVYQFYYSLGLYRTAEMKMAQLKKNYPTSQYLTDAAAETQQIPEEKADSVLTTAKPAAAAEKFTLQVGAFTAAVNAEKQRTFFEGLGYPVEVLNRVKEGRSLFVVLVGTFESAEQAKAQGAEIKKKHNIDTMVTTK
jgi:hypothetical protein